MTKREIAREIVAVCQRDASFCKEIEGGDPQAFFSEIRDGMPERDFLFAVERYLATFKVWGHLYFYRKQRSPSLGFRVRRYGESLFVTHAEPSLPFAKGDAIVAIDGRTIAQAAEKYSVFFESDPPDRQGERWETLLAYAGSVTVRAQRTFDYAVRTDIPRGESGPSCVCRPLRKDCFYIKLTNFFDEGDITSITELAAKKITSAKHLILDLRTNCGGNDVEFLPLFRFLLAENDSMCGKQIFSAEDEILYTERNAEARVALYEEYLAETASEEVRNYLLAQIAEQRQNRGKGFLPAKADEFRFPASGTRYPEKVVLLTDCDCASSAESFVEIAARLQKVTVIGRPTMGITDYSNLARVDFGDYVLHYPTSRSRAIDSGKGTRGKGLQPDIFVPWTPRHLFEDVDLTAAVRWLETSD